MKKGIEICLQRLCFLLVFLIAASAGFAQVPIKRKPVKVNPHVITKPLPQPIPESQAPDLTITEFTINYHARQRVGDIFRMPLKVVITNSGTQPVTEKFFLAVQSYSPNFNRWGPTGRKNCFPIENDIAAGANYTLNTSMQLADHEISDRNIRLRGYADWGCNREFPPPNGDIAESDETNNFSTEVSFSGDYSPRITEVRAKIGTRKDQFRLIGLNFGSTPDGHVVRLQNGPDRFTGIIKYWKLGIIDFTLPQDIPYGEYRVSIATPNSNVPLSNEVNLKVADERILDFAAALEIFRDYIRDHLADSMQVKMHSLKGKCGYKNASTIMIFGNTDTILVPKIEKETCIGEYRWLVNDLKTKEGGFDIRRTSLQPPNELTFIIEFESGGIELKGCFSPVGQSSFNETGSPDIEINNGILYATFQFRWENGALDYDVKPIFSASIKPHHQGWEQLMDWVYGEWNSRIYREIYHAAENGLEEFEVRQKITNEILNLVRQLTFSSQMTIGKVTFEADGWHLLVY